jgi:hypothetical protein
LDILVETQQIAGDPVVVSLTGGVIEQVVRALKVPGVWGRKR